VRFTNRHGLPQSLVDAVTNDPYDNGGAWRSVTQLIAPARQVLLKKRHEPEIVVDVSERLFALYGQIVHGILERANTADLVEDRLFTEVRGKKISGGYDVLQLQNAKLVDWKFSTVWKAFGTSDEWTAQLNLLALLIRRQMGIELRELEIILLMRDHSKPKARREENYPQLPVKRIPITLWSKDQQEQYLYSRVDAHLLAEEKLPLCSDPETWAQPTVYAVKKKGNKSAVRNGLFYDKQRALECAITLNAEKKGQYFIETRPGERKRCADYCEAAPFCEQFREYARVGPVGSTDT
jgi:hypothetical protein